MTVQKGETTNALYVGESYDPPVKDALKRYPSNVRKDQNFIKNIKAQFESISHLKIPYKMKCIMNE